MIKITVLVLTFCPFALRSMEGNEEFRPSEWVDRRLGSLLAESQSPTCNEFNFQIRELKYVFVKKYVEKYNEEQGILSDLLHETGGVISATTDPELAQKDSNKFLCINPLMCTARQIDERWDRIHQADCKYISANVAKNGCYVKGSPVS